ncbi:MAG: hypothetical protein CFE44_08235 [Burkholderiales bacterium PBB4]|nr:MAG: hypothetical protein CFE44_08235 [Burkholderiales bacterium PBB4]
MKRTLAIVALLASFVSPAIAADRIERVRSLMQAQGLIETFEQMVTAGRISGRTQASQILPQILGSTSPNEEFRTRFSKAVELFIDELQPPWGAKEIVEVWSDLYASQFSDAELDGLLAYYTSALAQKEVAVSRSALSKFVLHFQEKQRPLVQAATTAYVERLKVIAAECNCTN